MEHIAIDLGAKESRLCVRSGGGKIVEEPAKLVFLRLGDTFDSIEWTRRKD